MVIIIIIIFFFVIVLIVVVSMVMMPVPLMLPPVTMMFFPVQMVVRDVRPAGAEDGIDFGDTTAGAHETSKVSENEPELAGVTEDTSR